MKNKKSITLIAVLFFLIGTIFSGTFGVAANYLFGDINGDGKITASDARLLLRASARLEELKEPNYEKPATPSEKKYSVGDTINIQENGKTLYKIRINSIKTTNERNEYSDKKPKQVIEIDYTYENISSKEDIAIYDWHFKIIDGDKNVCSTYPLSPANYADTVPIGAKCTAQDFWGLNSSKKELTILFYASPFDDSATLSIAAKL